MSCGVYRKVCVSTGCGVFHIRHPSVLYLSVRNFEICKTRSSMAEEAGVEEDWERQRVFYDTIRESIVSRDVAMRLLTGDLAAVVSNRVLFSRYVSWCF